jgi:protein SCO1
MQIDKNVSNPAAQAEGTVPAPRAVYSGRRLRWAVLVGLLLLVFAAAGYMIWQLRPVELHGVLLQSPREVTGFSLMSSQGEAVNITDFRGKFVMLYFGYTFCPDACPMTLNDLAQMLKLLDEKQRQQIQILFVSVDPARDSAEHLASYLPYFDPSFIGLTGAEEEIQPVASQFGIFFARQQNAPADGYLVDHTSAVTVVDPNGYVRMVFPYGVTAEEMAADMRYLLRRAR